MIRRLRAAGLTAVPQAFQVPLFTPGECGLRVGAEMLPAFPGWPAKTTPVGGLTGPLAPHDAPDLSGRIALIVLDRERGGAWAAKGVGDVAMQTARRGPLAIVVVTGGPTGAVVALNTDLARFDWPVPVLLAPGRLAAQLTALAATGAPATAVLTGTLTSAATADNVVARRPGTGPGVVVSTPKTGWFHCAGERGTGIAVFLDLARRLAAGTRCDLTFVAFAGHELDYLGARRFRPSAPAPSKVGVWLHIGADAAMQPLTVKNGVAAPAPRSAPIRRATAAPAVLAAASAAFDAGAGFAPAAPLTEANAAGELSVFRPDYTMLAGFLGANPLFHTPLDRADVATTAEELRTVAHAARGFLRAALAGARG